MQGINFKINVNFNYIVTGLDSIFFVLHYKYKLGTKDFLFKPKAFVSLATIT